MKIASPKKQERVSNLYAKALFERAKETDQIEIIQNEFSALASFLQEEPQLIKALSAFVYPMADRERLLDEVLKKLSLTPLLGRLLKLLLEKNRLQLFASVYYGFRALVDENQDIVRGSVTSAEPLSSNEVADLAKAFSKKLNKQVVLDPILDRDLLGGLIVKIRELTFDGSLKTIIHQLRERLERQSI